MSKLSLVLLFCVACSGSCLPVGSTGVTWPPEVKCATDEIPDVIAAVSHILLADGEGPTTLSDSRKQDLEQLAVKYGASAIECAISRLQQDWTTPGRTQTPLTVGAAARAREFFKEKGIRSQPVPPTSLNERGPNGPPLAVLIARDNL